MNQIKKTKNMYSKLKNRVFFSVMFFKSYKLSKYVNMRNTRDTSQSFDILEENKFLKFNSIIPLKIRHYFVHCHRVIVILESFQFEPDNVMPNVFFKIIREVVLCHTIIITRRKITTFNMLFNTSIFFLLFLHVFCSFQVLPHFFRGQ